MSQEVSDVAEPHVRTVFQFSKLEADTSDGRGYTSGAT